MYILKIFINYSKEEKWLNEMSKKGYEVTSNSFGYTFRSINPDDITYRIDYRTFKNKKDFIDYCTIFEDSGWKHILGSKYSGKQYFKKVSDKCDEDIFSDNISKANRYKRASNIWLRFSRIYLVLLIVFALTGVININAFINPKELYLTPGLWEETGIRFLIKFLFETPFALGRGFIWLVYPISILIYFYCILKASKLYKETIKDKALF